MYEKLTIEQLRERLRDAEITIAKIGYTEPAPSEARKRYETKHGTVEPLEWQKIEAKQ